MKYCQFCGHQVDDDAIVCGACGRQIAYPDSDGHPKSTETEKDRKEVQTSGNIGWGFLGFFIPLAGLVLYCVWRQERSKDAHYAGVGAIIGASIQFVAVVILVVIFIVNLVRTGMAAGFPNTYFNSLSVLFKR